MSDDSDDKTVVLADGAGAKPAGAPGGAAVPAAHLLCTDAGQLDLPPAQKTLALRDGHEVVIGRDPGCQLHIASPKLSRRHARIFAGSGTWGVEDLNSTNGVFVNGAKINAAWLRHGDEVRVGPITYRFELERPGASAAPAPSAAVAARDEDESERTMMVGSLQASEAVLAAAREREAEKVRKAETEASTARAEAALPSRRKSKAPLYVAAVVAVAVAGGVGWFVLGSGSGEVEALMNRSNALSNQVVQRAREKGSNLGATYTSEHEQIAALLPALQAGIAAHPGEAGLAMALVRLQFLDFERSFVELIGKNDTQGAVKVATTMSATAHAAAAALPAGPLADEAKVLADMADLSRIIGEFRGFVRAFPDAATNAAAKPTVDQVNHMMALKQDFSRLRKSHNSPLQVTYVALRDVVKDVDEKDILVINDWREVVGR